MTYQRRRGNPVTIYPWKLEQDARGNTLRVPDYDNPITRRGAHVPQRSSRAEVPGQVEVNVIRLLVPNDVPNFGLWAEVEYLGRRWDVAAPPAEHDGNKLTRHLSIDLRERPAKVRQ